MEILVVFLIISLSLAWMIILGLGKRVYILEVNHRALQLNDVTLHNRLYRLEQELDKTNKQVYRFDS